MSKRSLAILGMLVSVALIVSFATGGGVSANDVGLAVSAWVAGCLTMCLLVKPRPRRAQQQRLDRVNGLLETSNANLDRAFGQLQEMKDKKRMDA